MTGAAVVDLPDSLSGRTAFLLRLAAARAEDLGERALRDEGITGREYGVLEMLGHRAPQSQIALGRALRLDRTTCAAVLAGLDARGLVRRVADPADRRANLVSLTVAGERRREAASAVLAACDTEFQSALSAEERRVLGRLLRALVEA